MEENSNYCVKKRDQMRTVDVVFVSDELVGSTIVSKKEYERVLRQKQKAEADKTNTHKPEDTGNGVEIKTPKRKANQEVVEVNSKRTKYIDDVELALAALENDDVEKVTLSHPSTLYDDEDVAAKKICSFQNSTHTPKTPNNIKIKLSNNTNNVLQTNLTSNNLRKRVMEDIKEIQKILENSDDDFSGSESDSSYKFSDDSLSDGRESLSPKDKSKYKSYFEGYCDLQSTKKSKSKNSLKNLKNPKLTQEKLDELVKNFQISSAHKNSIKTLFNDSLSLFSKWDFILQQNYNLLLYGAGSKREIIGKFVERFTETHPVVVINGFFPDISGKEIVDRIYSVLKIKGDSSDVIESIQSKIENYDIRIYLAINNIDGIMLRSPKIQSILSQLGKLEQIHIIASIDHINAPLIWNKSTSSEFNWIWYDCTTFLSYSEETLYEGNLMLQNSGKATLSSLRNVFNSITKNSRGIFMLMLKHQLEAENKKSGISFKELYQKCRKELLISSDVALRTQLKEFIDHLVVKQKRNADGEEQFVIVIENSILKQFLEEQEAQQN